jgi:hypothetical protein
LDETVIGLPEYRGFFSEIPFADLAHMPSVASPETVWSERRHRAAEARLLSRVYPHDGLRWKSSRGMSARFAGGSTVIGLSRVWFGESCSSCSASLPIQSPKRQHPHRRRLLSDQLESQSRTAIASEQDISNADRDLERQRVLPLGHEAAEATQVGAAEIAHGVA